MMKKKKLLILFFVVFCFFPLSVFAATKNVGGTTGLVEWNYCIPVGTLINGKDVHGAYHVNYISETATQVDYKKITYADIINGHLLLNIFKKIVMLIVKVKYKFVLLNRKSQSIIFMISLMKIIIKIM